jgi:hypothetical protein
VWGDFTHQLVVPLRPGRPVDVPPLFTNAFINLGGSPVPLIIFLALSAWFFQDLVRWLWYRRRTELIATVVGGFVGLFLIDRYVLPGVWGLVSAVLVLGWFATSVERRWGARRLLLFSFWVVTFTDLLANVVLWAWPDSIAPMTGGGGSPPWGNQALTGALLTAWALMIGHQRLMVLRIEGYKLVYVLLAFSALEFLFVGRAEGLYSAGGILVARLLIGGTWRPDRWYNELRLWRLRRRNARRRAELKVIKGEGGRDRPTLHRIAPEMP